MTMLHILYIPTIFLLGLIFGIMVNEKRQGIIDMDSMKTANQNSRFQHKTSGNRLFHTFLVFLLVFLITHMFEIPWGSKAVSQLLGGLEIFDRSPVFSDTEVYMRINQFPTEGLLAYKRFTYTTDIIFPLSFFVFLLTLAGYVSQRITIPKYLMNALISLPIFWFLFDMIENAVIFSLLSIFPSQNKALANSLGAITSLKFGLLLLAIFAPSLLFIFSKKVMGPIKKFELSES